jgi:hypothetical protein
MCVAMHLTIAAMLMICEILSRIETFEGHVSVARLHEIHQVEILRHSGLWVGLHHAYVVYSPRGNLGDSAVHHGPDQPGGHLRGVQAVVRGCERLREVRGSLARTEDFVICS